MNSNVENLHGCFPKQLRIGCNQLFWDHIIIEVQLQRESESDYIEIKLFLDMSHNLSEGSTLETPNAMSFSVSSWPVDSSKFHSASSSIDNAHSSGWKGELDIFYIIKRLFLEEFSLFPIEFQHELLIFCEFCCVPHWIFILR